MASSIASLTFIKYNDDFFGWGNTALPRSNQPIIQSKEKQMKYRQKINTSLLNIWSKSNCLFSSKSKIPWLNCVDEYSKAEMLIFTYYLLNWTPLNNNGNKTAFIYLCIVLIPCLTYWPSIQPSIEKPVHPVEDIILTWGRVEFGADATPSRSRWMSNNYITRCHRPFEWGGVS